MFAMAGLDSAGLGITSRDEEIVWKGYKDKWRESLATLGI